MPVTIVTFPPVLRARLSFNETPRQRDSAKAVPEKSYE
jgi:hypothetical protein